MSRSLIAVVIWICLSNALIAQQLLEKSVSISFDQSSIANVLEDLEEFEGLRFSYNPDILPDRLVSGSFEQVQVKEILNEILGGQANFKTRGSYIIIQSINNLFSHRYPAWLGIYTGGQHKTRRQLFPLRGTYPFRGTTKQDC